MNNIIDEFYEQLDQIKTNSERNELLKDIQLEIDILPIGERRWTPLLLDLIDQVENKKVNI